MFDTKVQKDVPGLGLQLSISSPWSIFAIIGVLGAKDYLKNSGDVQPLPFVHSRGGGCNFKIAIPHPVTPY